MKIGIYGGTFNPIHKGHIYFAETAIKELKLDKVILIPDNIPPHKSNQNSAPPKDRLNMCRLAAMGINKIEVSDMEIKRDGISYTVDTLREIKISHPKDSLFLLLGTDMFCTLEKWKEYTEILRLATVVGAPRELRDLSTLLIRQKQFKEQGFETLVLPLNPIEISSTEIRAGDDGELDRKVLNYIEQNELYGCPFKFSPNLDKMKAAVKEKLSEERFTHSVNVANEALVLARLNNYNPTKAYAAGILHDFCKEIEKSEMLKILSESDIINDRVFLNSPKIWHGFAAAQQVSYMFNIYCPEILSAIRYHSTGCPNMTILDKIIYMADLLSAERSYDGVDALRVKTENNLNEGLKEALQFSLGKLISEDKPLIYLTVEAYNDLILNKKEAEI